MNQDDVYKRGKIMKKETSDEQIGVFGWRPN